MDNLESQAQKIERDHSAIKQAALRLHHQCMLDEKLLSHTIEKAYNLGHQAGFKRGQLFNEYENNKRKRKAL